MSVKRGKDKLKPLKQADSMRDDGVKKVVSV